MVAPASLRIFQRRLLAWYRVHQRKLPWRETRDPYKILVSEIMLQQTQVDRVMPKYHEFLRRYPTLKALASARTPELKKMWYPLGYNIRPLRLRRIAQRAIREHHGRIPNSYEGLLAMDGIGRYTAGAVLSFAFEQDAPIVDTNIARLLSRYFGLKGGPKRGRTQKRLWQLAKAVIPEGRGYDINQAMMDMGATVCTARAPRCPTCVMRRTCRSFPMQKTAARPRTADHERRSVNDSGKAGRPIQAALAVIERNGRYLIAQRRAGGFLGGYWEFPGGKRLPGEGWKNCLQRELQEELGIAAQSLTHYMDLRYRDANRSIRFQVFRCRLKPGTPKPLAAQALRWVSPVQLRRHRFPPANKPLIDRLAGLLPPSRRRATIMV